MTTLEEVTENILSAIAKKDFQELDKEVKRRTRLLRSGEEATPRAWELGEQACRALTSLRQEIILESSRLEEVRLRLEQILKIGMKVPEHRSSRKAYLG